MLPHSPSKKDTSLRSDVLLRACPKNDNVRWQNILFFVKIKVTI